MINYNIVRKFPRHSTRFAKRWFNNKPITVIEIGTYKGYNAKDIFKNLNVKSFFAIDPYKDYGEEGKDNKDLINAKEQAGFRLKEHKKDIFFIKEYSDKALDKVPIVDFIYIDGEHTYHQSKRDMINYWDKLSPGGIFAGHDITNPRDNYGVARAFVEFCAEKGLKPYISRTDWWVVKPLKSRIMRCCDTEYIVEGLEKEYCQFCDREMEEEQDD